MEAVQEELDRCEAKIPFELQETFCVDTKIHSVEKFRRAGMMGSVNLYASGCVTIHNLELMKYYPARKAPRSFAPTSLAWANAGCAGFP